jgi:hypothetical protein
MTTDLQRRYGRQMRLPEIGQGGQGKLCAAKVAVSSTGFVRTIEERYVRLAGMQVAEDEASVDPESGDVSADVTSLGLRHPPAREVAEGALRALIAIRTVLETKGPS